jgi:hypothetical protein
MIDIPSFVKIGSAIQKLIGETHRHTERGDRTILLLYFQNKEIKLKANNRR